MSDRTSLRESWDRWPPTDVEEEPFADGGQVWRAWRNMVHGASAALGVELAAHTAGPDLGIINVDADTAAPDVDRDAITYPDDLREAFRMRISRINWWAQDPHNWGPGPYDYPEEFDGPPQRGDKS